MVDVRKDTGAARAALARRRQRAVGASSVTATATTATPSTTNSTLPPPPPNTTGSTGKIAQSGKAEEKKGIVISSDRTNESDAVPTRPSRPTILPLPPRSSSTTTLRDPPSPPSLPTKNASARIPSVTKAGAAPTPPPLVAVGNQQQQQQQQQHLFHSSTPTTMAPNYLEPISPLRLQSASKVFLDAATVASSRTSRQPKSPPASTPRTRSNKAGSTESATHHIPDMTPTPLIPSAPCTPQQHIMHARTTERHDQEEDPRENKDQSNEEEEEESETEEEEPFGVDILQVDAACLSYGSFVMIRSQATLGHPSTGVAVAVVHPQQSSLSVDEDTCNAVPLSTTTHKISKKYIAAATGRGLGQDTELFRMVPSSPLLEDKEHSANANNGSTRGDQYATDTAARVVRYGDTIALVSLSAQDRALGVKKQKRLNENDDRNNNNNIQSKQKVNDEVQYELGFVRNVLGQAEKWTILRASNSRIVSVGTHALARLRRKKQPLVSPLSCLTAAVRSGDCILLRNEYTGGLLSMQHQHQQHHGQNYQPHRPVSVSNSGNNSSTEISAKKICLVTHSYNSNKIENGSTKDPSLLGRVQRHDRIQPRLSEVFQLVHSSVPPCPQWTCSSSETNNCREYLNGSYLLRSKRHEGNNTNNDDKGDKFEEACAASNFFGNLPTAILKTPNTEQCTLKSQERLLLVDIIGTMMGLEGRYIRYQVKEGYQMKSIDNMEFRLINSEVGGKVLDVSLYNLVKRILPLSTAFCHVQSFLACRFPGYEYGTVMQALCETIDTLMQEYLYFCTEMERLSRSSARNLINNWSSSSSLTMNTLYVHLKPALETMSILKRVVDVSRPHKGGALLNALRTLLIHDYAGDEKGQQVLQFLLEKASVPFMYILHGWLEGGVLRDPYHEFMIEVPHESNSNFERGTKTDFTPSFDGDSWKESHHIREDHVLEGVLSDETMKQKIMMTGKYWNAVRYCRITNRPAENDDNTSLVGDSSWSFENNEQTASSLRYNMDLAAVSLYVDLVYRKASGVLLRMLLDNFGLMESLRTVKRYFLLDQGDFLVHFLDAAEEELLQELPQVSRGRIQNWLVMCVQLTEHAPSMLNSQAHLPVQTTCPLTADSIRCTFSSESLGDHLDALHAESGGIETHEPKTPSRHAYGIVNKGLTGIEAFMLDFPAISFPTSLIISQRALASYQLLFRHLFFAKHVERRLVTIWLDHQMMKELQSLRKALGPTYCLRQRMLHFMQNLIYYMNFEVIEPNWRELEAAVNEQGESTKEDTQSQREGTVDSILDVHDEFLRKTLEQCLLTNRDLICTLTKLMTTCLLFSDQMKRFMEETKIFKDKVSHATAKRQAQQRMLNDPDYPYKGNCLRSNSVAVRDDRRKRLAIQTARVERELTNESYKRMISRFDEVFNKNLGEFMLQLKSGRHGENLFVRLDYNEYVSRSMGLK